MKKSYIDLHNARKFEKLQNTDIHISRDHNNKIVKVSSIGRLKLSLPNDAFIQQFIFNELAGVPIDINSFIENHLHKICETNMPRYIVCTHICVYKFL